MTEPRWLTAAKQNVGVREIVGPRHNPTILGWLRSLKTWVKDDETPWCGTFAAAMMQAANLPYPKEFLRAKSWATYGARLRADRVAPGAILVFSRDGGGHVGFYVGEDETYYHVLGGNQKNEVSVARIAKARCIAIRWPKDEPVLGSPVHMTRTASVAVSTNEA